MIAAGDPRSWYPAALSAEVRAKPRPLRVGSGDYLLFRGEDGAVSALGRYCLHMGADLALAKIVRGGLQCGLHGWKYGPDGVCTRREGEEPHTPVRLPRLATYEVGGVVYVWTGASPDWEFPTLPGIETPTAARPMVADLDCPMTAIGLNGFDISHYSVVHRREPAGLPEVRSLSSTHLGLSFTANVRGGRRYDDLLIRLGYGALRVQLDYWGGNLIFVRNASGGYLALLALAPLGPNRCRLYLSVFSEIARGRFTRLAQGVVLELYRLIAWRFIQPDIPVVSGMRPVEGLLVAGRDDVARRFWKWWRDLPRLEPDTK
jgi:nitrite reductase/ring-hydroxylating ferredoxin subunit